MKENFVQWEFFIEMFMVLPVRELPEKALVWRQTELAR